MLIGMPVWISVLAVLAQKPYFTAIILQDLLTVFAIFLAFFAAILTVIPALVAAILTLLAFFLTFFHLLLPPFLTVLPLFFRFFAALFGRWATQGAQNIRILLFLLPRFGMRLWLRGAVAHLRRRQGKRCRAEGKARKKGWQKRGNAHIVSC